MEEISIIVYGTLREGQTRHELLPVEVGQKKVIKVFGFKMFALPYGFPGVIHTNDNKDFFIAELWTFKLPLEEMGRLIKTLDAIEGTQQGIYQRVSLNIGDVDAYIYIYNLPTDNAVEIEDWNEYSKKNIYTKRRNNQRQALWRRR